MWRGDGLDGSFLSLNHTAVSQVAAVTPGSVAGVSFC